MRRTIAERSRSAAAEEELERRRRRELRRRAEAAERGLEVARDRLLGRVEAAPARAPRRRPSSRAAPPSASTSLSACASSSSRRSRHASATPRRSCAEARDAVPRLGREVRSRVERLCRRASGRRSSASRPGPVIVDARVHRDRIDVGALLAVDLDVHEEVVHERRRRRIRRTTRAPSRGTSGTSCSRPRRGAGWSSPRARANASSPHGYQSTGFSACWRRYGLDAVGEAVHLPCRTPIPWFCVRPARCRMVARMKTNIRCGWCFVGGVDHRRRRAHPGVHDRRLRPWRRAKAHSTPTAASRWSCTSAQLMIVIGAIWAWWGNWWRGRPRRRRSSSCRVAQLAFLGDTEEPGGWINGLHGMLALVILLVGAWCFSRGRRELGLGGASIRVLGLGATVARFRRRSLRWRISSTPAASPTATTNARMSPFHGCCPRTSSRRSSRAGRVRPPDEPGEDVRDDEPPVRERLGVARRERRRGPAAGDEPRDDDQVVPRCISWRSAHSKAVWPSRRERRSSRCARRASGPARTRCCRRRSLPSRAARITSQSWRSPAPARTPAVIDHGLARHEREEGVDRRHGEDRGVAPPGARDPSLERVEHASIGRRAPSPSSQTLR